MSRTSIEDKRFIMERLNALMSELGIKVIKVRDYSHLLESLNLDDTWSNTRLQRVTGSLHANGRYIRVSRDGEPMRGDTTPRGVVVQVLKPFDA